MARKQTQSSTPAPAQAVQEAAATDTKFQAASETEAKSEGAAAPADGAEVEAPDAQTATDAADLAGTTDGSAPSEEEIRERTDGASPDRKDAPDGGIQPEEAVQPPVAERRCFPVNWDLNHDGTVFSPGSGEWPALTEAEFNALRPGGVIDGEWDDGEPADD